MQKKKIDKMPNKRLQESRVEKQTTSVDIDSIFDENGCLQSLDALGDILGDDSGYSDDSPKVLRR